MLQSYTLGVVSSPLLFKYGFTCSISKEYRDEFLGVCLRIDIRNMSESSGRYIVVDNTAAV